MKNAESMNLIPDRESFRHTRFSNKKNEGSINEYQHKIYNLINSNRKKDNFVWFKLFAQDTKALRYNSDVIFIDTNTIPRIILVKIENKWVLPVLENTYFIKEIESIETFTRENLPDREFDPLFDDLETKKKQRKKIEQKWNNFLLEAEILYTEGILRQYSPKKADGVYKEIEGELFSPFYIFKLPQDLSLYKYNRKMLLEEMSVFLVFYGNQVSLPFIDSETFQAGITDFGFFSFKEIQKMISELEKKIINKENTPRNLTDCYALKEALYILDSFKKLIDIMKEFSRDLEIKETDKHKKGSFFKHHESLLQRLKSYRKK